MQGEKGVDIKATSRQARRFYYDFRPARQRWKFAKHKKRATSTKCVVAL